MKLDQITPPSFKSYSQCGQDRFVHAVLNGKTDGIFADVGMSHPVEINNTYGLEKVGWRGFMVDNDPGCTAAVAASDRKCPFIFHDATTLLWDPIVGHFGREFDYLSLDVDAASLGALKAIPLRDVTFRVITIEHDSYRFGPEPREAMREILGAAGYVLVCADVKSEGQEFEDWWVHQSEASTNVARFQCESTPWQEILKRK